MINSTTKGVAMSDVNTGKTNKKWRPSDEACEEFRQTLNKLHHANLTLEEARELGEAFLDRISDAIMRQFVLADLISDTSEDVEWTGNRTRTNSNRGRKNT
jgi:meiotically up-regulated gene 157 (Mug157) protein